MQKTLFTPAQCFETAVMQPLPRPTPLPNALGKPANQPSLSGRIALVTGAARGIGKAIAGQLALQGATTILLDATLETVKSFEPYYPLAPPKALQQTVDALQKMGCSVYGLQADVRQQSALHTAFSTIEKRWGNVDILVNNAGIGKLCSVLETSSALWRLHHQVIVDAAFFGAQRALSHMCKQRWGRIINIASVAGLMGLSHASAYVSAKHALIGLTRALSAELGPHGVCVNAVCPGTVNSPMALQMTQGFAKNEATGMENFSARHTLKTPLEPHDIAHAVAWLASEHAVRMKGQCLTLDDGWCTTG